MQTSVIFKISFLTFTWCLLTGCVTRLGPPQNLTTLHNPKIIKKYLSRSQSFEISGKLGFSDGKKGGNAFIDWQQASDEYHIRLYGPLGSGSLQINGYPKDISLTKEDGQIVRATTPETLVQDQLGWSIPVSGLRYWILGTPAPGIPPQELQVDDKNRLWLIQQQGWTVTYQSYQTQKNQDLPKTLTLKNGPLRLKFILNNWKLIP